MTSLFRRLTRALMHFLLLPFIFPAHTLDNISGAVREPSSDNASEFLLKIRMIKTEFRKRMFAGAT